MKLGKIEIEAPELILIVGGIIIILISGLLIWKTYFAAGFG